MQVTKITALVMLCATLTVSACGSSTKTESTTNVTTTTTGQELTDLKAAYDSGAITEEEDEAKRKAILES